MANTALVQFINNENGRRFENDKIIIIVAYAKSGSSFTGSIFREVTDAFYLYEPIRVLRYTFYRLRGANVTLSNFRGYFTTQNTQVYMDGIDTLLHCNLSSFCIPRHIEKQSTPNEHGCCGQNGAFNSCLQVEENYCEKSPVKVMKFIRLRMRYLLQLLQIYPNMKVIHLVRDPRGIMSSKKFKLSPLHKLNVKIHCDKLAENLIYTKKIILQYPKKLKIVNYENLAEHPIQTTMEMFQFAGLNFSNKVQTYLQRHTQTYGDRHEHVLCRNSSATAIKWRTMLDSPSAIFIYSACRLSNKVLGYLPISSESEMKNYTIPSRKLLNIRQQLLSSKHF